jgi:hypothetical protein
MSLVGTVLERAGGFLLEPAEQPPPPAPDAPAEASLPGPVSLAVVGMSPGSGARTLAAGVALTLGRHGEQPQLVSLGRSRPAAAVPHACEVPPALVRADEVAAYGGTLLRLAGGAAGASSVWSVPAREASRAATVLSEVDAVMAIAGRASDPALSGMVCSLLAERCRQVLLVANVTRDRDQWSRWAAVCLPESRLGAGMLARGLLPGGRLGRALHELAALSAGVAGGTLAPHHGLYTGKRAT